MNLDALPTRAYLDTSAWNHLFEQPNYQDMMAELEEHRKLIPSHHTIEEIAIDPDQDQALRRLEIMRQLANRHGLLGGSVIIMKREIMHVLNGTEINWFMPAYKADDFINNVVNLIKTGRADIVRQRLGEGKRCSLERHKQMHKDGRLINPTKAAYLSLGKDWHKAFADNPTMIQCIEIFGSWSMGRNLRKHELKRLRGSLDTMLALRNEFLYFLLMVCRATANSVGPKWGDDYDGNHFVAASNMDFLVSDDVAFKNLVAPAARCYRPKVCSLTDFLATHGLTAEEIHIG